MDEEDLAEMQESRKLVDEEAAGAHDTRAPHANDELVQPTFVREYLQMTTTLQFLFSGSGRYAPSSQPIRRRHHSEENGLETGSGNRPSINI